MKGSFLKFAFLTGTLSYLGIASASVYNQESPFKGSNQTLAQPLYPEPSSLPAELNLEQQKSELQRLRSEICRNFRLASVVITNKGMLSQVAEQLEKLTGRRNSDLQTKGLSACAESNPTDDISISELHNQIKTIEWLNRAQLAAIVFLTDRQQELRPVNAQGSFADFLRVHDVINSEISKGLVALRTGDATLEEFRSISRIWDIVLEHEKAEDKFFYRIADTIDNPDIASSIRQIEAEHRQIESLMTRYKQLLSQFEMNQKGSNDLLKFANDIRSYINLHFAKEEQLVARPLMELEGMTDDFQQIVEEHDRQIGSWLRARGWNCQTCRPGQ